MNTLKEQLQTAVINHSGLFAEYEMPCDEYLLVHFQVDDEGLYITGDFSLPRYFSGEVIEKPCGFIVPFDPEYFENLDHYLQFASDEITEGYLYPNGLYV